MSSSATGEHFIMGRQEYFPWEEQRKKTFSSTKLRLLQQQSNQKRGFFWQSAGLPSSLADPDSETLMSLFFHFVAFWLLLASRFCFAAAAIAAVGSSFVLRESAIYNEVGHDPVLFYFVVGCLIESPELCRRSTRSDWFHWAMKNFFNLSR